MRVAARVSVSLAYRERASVIDSFTLTLGVGWEKIGKGLGPFPPPVECQSEVRMD